MVKGKEDLLQALIEVFIMEKGTREFYSHASEKAVHPEAKKTFRELSAWEEKHMNYVQYLYQSVLGNIETESFEDFKSRTHTPITEGGIPVKELESRIAKYTVSDETGALTLAMEIEGKAYDFYRRLSVNAEDTNARVVFKEMMEQEVEHVKYLKELRLRLTNVQE